MEEWNNPSDNKLSPSRGTTWPPLTRTAYNTFTFTLLAPHRSSLHRQPGSRVNLPPLRDGMNPELSRHHQRWAIAPFHGPSPAEGPVPHRKENGEMTGEFIGFPIFTGARYENVKQSRLCLGYGRVVGLHRAHAPDCPSELSLVASIRLDLTMLVMLLSCLHLVTRTIIQLEPLSGA